MSLHDEIIAGRIRPLRSVSTPIVLLMMFVSVIPYVIHELAECFEACVQEMEARKAERKAR